MDRYNLKNINNEIIVMLANKNIRYKSDAVVPVSSYPLERLKKLSCLADKEIHKAKLIVTISVKISKSLF